MTECNGSDRPCSDMLSCLRCLWYLSITCCSPGVTASDERDMSFRKPPPISEASRSVWRTQPDDAAGPGAPGLLAAARPRPAGGCAAGALRVEPSLASSLMALPTITPPGPER